MVVLDEDRAKAEEFLAEQGIEPEQDADALAVCRAWLKSLREARRDKLRIGCSWPRSHLGPLVSRNT